MRPELSKTFSGPGLLVALLLGGHPTIHAAEPPLITDRPDQTESAFTVPRGLLQIEAGWGYAELDDDIAVQAFPQVLLRIGLSERFEIRLGLPDIEIEQTDVATGTSTTSGIADATAGFKVVIADERGIRPQTAFLGSLAIPTGDDEFTADHLDPGFRFALSHTLSSRLSLGYNLGMLWHTEATDLGSLETGSHFDWTVALGVATTERLGVFLEAFGLTPIDAEAGTITAVDAGLTYLLTPLVQLDAAIGAGLSRVAPDWTVGAGISCRFPRRH